MRFAFEAGETLEIDKNNQIGSYIIKINHIENFIMTAFTVRVPYETANHLDQLAEKMDRSRAYLAAQAIKDFVERESWQLAEIEAGIAEADAGEFAEPEEVARVIAKFMTPIRSI